MAFIQSSDYHGDDKELGTRITYLHLKEFDFKSVIYALKNPNECVSPTAHPKIINILNQIINDPKTIAIKNIDNEFDIAKAICAILNDGYGTLVIGVNSDSSTKSIIGLNNSYDQCKEIINRIIKTIIPYPYNYNINKFAYGNRLVIVLKLSSKGSKIFCLDEGDTSFILDNNAIKKAKPQHIAKIVEDRLFNRLLEYNNINKKRINNLIAEINQLTENYQQFYLINKIEKNSLMLFDIIKIKFVKPFEDDLGIKFYNGDACGNIAVINRVYPRLPYAYLRCSCPKSNKLNIADFKGNVFNGSALIVAPGGGSFYMEGDEWVVVSLTGNQPSLVVTLREEFKDIFSELLILGWLKSSLLLWYAYITFNNINLYIPPIFENIPIPVISVMQLKDEIEGAVKLIIEKEKEFLTSIQEDKLIESEYKKIYDQIIRSHNKSVDNYARQIDSFIYDALKISDEEKLMIHNFLRNMNLYNFYETNLTNKVNESN